MLAPMAPGTAHGQHRSGNVRMGAAPASIALLLSTLFVPPSDVPFDLSYDDFASHDALNAESIAAWPYDPPECGGEGGLNLARIDYPAGTLFPLPFAAGADLESDEPERELELAAPTTVCKLTTYPDPNLDPSLDRSS